VQLVSAEQFPVNLEQQFEHVRRINQLLLAEPGATYIRVHEHSAKQSGRSIFRLPARCAIQFRRLPALAPVSLGHREGWVVLPVCQVRFHYNVFAAARRRFVFSRTVAPGKQHIPVTVPTAKIT
jgi:hypothetical protein